MTATLFQAIQLGKLRLKHRIVMPPMTRSRATQPGDTANQMMAEYYMQRCEAGLIIGEGTQISERAKGYAWTPGIYSQAQIDGWRLVTDAVHQQAGVIFAQLWHVGRVTHPDNINGAQPWSASPLKAENVKVFVDNGSQQPGFIDVVTPKQMSQKEINLVIEQFRQAALNAQQAGFDGVELHAANGYLINQFIDSESNQRTDAYGGSLSNRLRFLDEVLTALVGAIGADKVAVRLAPLTTLNGTVDAYPEQTYTAVAELLNQHQVVYMHIAEADWDDAPPMPLHFKQALRKTYAGTIIYAGKYTAASANQAIEDGLADMIAFGRPFIANPDLPSRIKHHQAWASHDPNTLFGGNHHGLTDYPRFEHQ
ncbi:alkene reductase [Agarivorans sp. QJM3NY_33]|uniref:alkene reductase n=1 Tax=Agarivorans sp. QJM3NY_33 TaxID=3421432 RepID=UPI003D7ECB32